ncbi:hypothetical protein THAOC_22496, partial [Thalassiosira oceanica]
PPEGRARQEVFPVATVDHVDHAPEDRGDRGAGVISRSPGGRGERAASRAESGLVLHGDAIEAVPQDAVDGLPPASTLLAEDLPGPRHDKLAPPPHGVVFPRDLIVVGAKLGALPLVPPRRFGQLRHGPVLLGLEADGLLVGRR